MYLNTKYMICTTATPVLCRIRYLRLKATTSIRRRPGYRRLHLTPLFLSETASTTLCGTAHAETAKLPDRSFFSQIIWGSGQWLQISIFSTLNTYPRAFPQSASLTAFRTDLNLHLPVEACLSQDMPFPIVPCQLCSWKLENSSNAGEREPWNIW